MWVDMQISDRINAFLFCRFLPGVGNCIKTIFYFINTFTCLCCMSNRSIPDITAPYRRKENYRSKLLGILILSTTGAGREGRICHSGATAQKHSEERYEKAGCLPVSRQTRPQGLRLGGFQGARHVTHPTSYKALGFASCKLFYGCF